MHMRPDFGNLTEMSHLIFWEIPILNIETTLVFLCLIVAMLDILYNWNNLLASVL